MGDGRISELGDVLKGSEFRDFGISEFRYGLKEFGISELGGGPFLEFGFLGFFGGMPFGILPVAFKKKGEG